MESIEKMIYLLRAKVDEFRAGSISYSLEQWKDITSDNTILGIVSGLPLDFEQGPPSSSAVVPSSFNSQEEEFVSTEISRLLSNLVPFTYLIQFSASCLS